MFDPGAPRGEWYGERVLARFEGNLPAQGPSAELVVSKWGYTREKLDDYAVRSHLQALERRDARRGLATLCEGGGGMANATIIERLT